jgi:hypothetical protein
VTKADVDTLTAEDLEFLRRPLYGFLSVAAAPVGERERWVSVAGDAAVEPDGAHDLAGMMTEDWVRFVIHPRKVRRYAMA